MKKYEPVKIILVWCDTETTDFDGPKWPLEKVSNGYLLAQQTGDLLQVGVVLTDVNLKVLRTAEINILPTNLEQANEESVQMAKDSGVFEKAMCGLPVEQAEAILIGLLETEREWHHEKVQFVLANCNAKFDMNWLQAHVPLFASKLYYRAIDVSAIEMAMRTVLPRFNSLVKKEFGHSALADVYEAIEHFRATQAILRSGLRSWDGVRLPIVNGKPDYTDMPSSFFEDHHKNQVNNKFDGERKDLTLFDRLTSPSFMRLIIMATVLSVATLLALG